MSLLVRVDVVERETCTMTPEWINQCVQKLSTKYSTRLSKVVAHLRMPQY